MSSKLDVAEAVSITVDPAQQGSLAKSALASRSGSDAIVETLINSGVEFIFGYSGGGTMFLINSIVAAGLPSIGARTELGAAWMSYGYNRVRRRAASACLFHCVGALHASPIIYASKVDSTPFFMMDVNLSSSLDMREGLQDATEVYSALKPICKYIRKVVTAEDLPLAVRQSVLSASTGRFGPSVLDLAFQVLNQQTTCVSEQLTLPDRPAASQSTIDKALTLIRNAKNPVIIAGAGVHISDAAEQLLRFAETAGIPIVATSWGGRGVVPDQHPLFGGVMGVFGWVSANDIVQRADLWIAIGTTFSQMTTGAWSLDRPTNSIHVDIDPNQLGKIFQPSVGIAADAREVLSQLIDGLKDDTEKRDWAQDPWILHMQEEKRKWFEYHDALGETSSTPITQYYLINRLSKKLPADSLVVGDSGGHAFMLYRSFEYKQVTAMATGSRYMSLGASLPVAIGAKLAMPERTVVSYHGDGGFFYDFNEISVLAQYGIKVIIIIDNNHCLLANRSGMRMMGFENPWAELPQDTDFVGLAKAFGVEGELVVDPSNLDAAIDRALAAAGSYLIDVHTDPDTRIRRAIKDVVPILSDRPPSPGADKHVSPPLEGSWPNIRPKLPL